jgi:hypothetical protein
MSERRIGFIPGAVALRQDMEPCGVFVTDQRMILVFEGPTIKGVKAGLKASFGAEADVLPEPRPQTDYAMVDIESLAKKNDNISVPHISIEKLAIGKGIGGYGIWCAYTGENMKKQYLVVTFVPPPDLVKKRKAEGLSTREVRREYAMKCQEVFKRALPPIIAEKVDWKI